MKHIVSFSALVFIPLFMIYIHQRNNDQYKGFKWTKFNDLGLVICSCLLLFIFFANTLAPNFVYRFNIGWHGHRSNEYTYAFWWFVSLSLVIFPHVYKRSRWKLFPTAIQRESMYKTRWYRLGGFLLISVQTIRLVDLSS